MIRQLTIDDINNLSRVLPKTEIEEFKNKFLLGLVSWFSFGLFQDNELLAVSTAYFNIESGNEWYMLKQHSNNSENLELLVHGVCNFFETRKIYKFYWLDAEFYVDNMKNYIPKKYIHYIDEKINPLFTPRVNKIFPILYDSRVLPLESTIYLSILTDEYKN
jgi:hypothetical protein